MDPTLHTRPRSIAIAITLAAAAALAYGGAATPANAATVWLCKPGLAANPCTPSLRTTLISTAGTPIGVRNVRPVRNPKIDCFYVYPTVSDQKTPQATLRIDPEQRSTALYQAARYSQECRVYAPMYRQITLQGLPPATTVTTAMVESAYADVRNAWREYLRRENHGRGVVLIGHSQGTFMLRRLVAEEVDPKPAIRKQLVAALLLGGNVLVKRGTDAGGDFKNVRACRSRTQTGCVVAFSTFNQTPPADAIFGRVGKWLPGLDLPVRPGSQVLCTNPAALGGGTGTLDTIYPSAPFAPGTVIGAATLIVGTPTPKVTTPWIERRGGYTARCSTAAGANALVISGAPVLRPSPDATWGLHLVDANIALGNLVDLVKAQAAAYARRAR